MRVSDLDEDMMVGETQVPRCPKQERIPLDVYVDDPAASGIKFDVDTIGDSKMSVTLIQKPKKTKAAKAEAVQAVQPAELSQQEQDTNELITLNAFMLEHDIKKKQARMETLRKQLAETADKEFPVDQPVTFTSTLGSVTFTAKGIERKIINMSAIIGKIGLEVFAKVVNLPFKNLDAVLSPVEQEQSGAVVKDATGARKMSIAPADTK